MHEFYAILQRNPVSITTVYHSFLLQRLHLNIYYYTIHSFILPILYLIRHKPSVLHSNEHSPPRPAAKRVHVAVHQVDDAIILVDMLRGEISEL